MRGKRTDVAQLEQRVLERTEELRKMNRKLLSETRARRRLERELLLISEAERRAFGQDLHDGLCQQLTGIAFLAKALSGKISGYSKNDAAELASLARVINESVSQARNIARGLHPVELDAHGLSAALSELVDKVNQKTPCRFSCQPTVKIDKPDAALNLYRIAQEAVTHAVRAHPDEIRIDLRHGRKGEIVLCVSDDGTHSPKPAARSDNASNASNADGKNESESTTEKKMSGWEIMRYRAHFIGATLSIRPRLPRGTVVTCLLPKLDRKNARG